MFQDTDSANVDISDFSFSAATSIQNMFQNAQGMNSSKRRNYIIQELRSPLRINHSSKQLFKISKKKPVQSERA